MQFKGLSTGFNNFFLGLICYKIFLLLIELEEIGEDIGDCLAKGSCGFNPT